MDTKKVNNMNIEKARNILNLKYNFTSEELKKIIDY